MGLTAFSTPFDDEAVDFLASLDVPAFKIASADLTCHGLIERSYRTIGDGPAKRCPRTGVEGR